MYMLMLFETEAWGFFPFIFRVNNLSTKRKKNLEVAKAYFQFLQDSEEEERWVLEKIAVVKQTDIGKDLNVACVLLKRHEVRAFTGWKDNPLVVFLPRHEK